MTLEFLQTVALWCTLSLSGGYKQTIEMCREQAIKWCSPLKTEEQQAICISSVVIGR